MTVAFTWNGLRALGVDEASLATFPEEFKQGMVARAEVLGDTGPNHPDNWVGGLNRPDLHAIVILFARDNAERDRCKLEHAKLLTKCDGVEVISGLDLEATPPFDHAHDHFGYRDRLSQPVIEGSGEEPTPGSGPSLKAGEFFLGYATKTGRLRIFHNRMSFLATGATWRIAVCRNMSLRFANSSTSMGRRPKNRNSSRRSSWAGGEVVHPLYLLLRKMIRRWVPIRSGITISTIRKWIRMDMRCR